MKTASTETFWAKIYIAGPIEVAKQIVRADCMREGLCVTIEPTTFMYTGGEEVGYVVGLVNYPRFPSTPDKIVSRARDLMHKLLEGTYQHSAMLMTPETTEWISKKEEQ
jgi:hypothetical protein